MLLKYGCSLIDKNRGSSCIPPTRTPKKHPIFGVKYGFHLSCIGDVFEMKMSYIGVLME